MKKIFIYAALAASMGGCVAPKPLPEGIKRVEAAYCGADKEGTLWVLKFVAKRYDTLKIQQKIKPRFRMNDIVYLEWVHTGTSLHDVKILKNK